MNVHNHGPEGGLFATDLPDITCPERRLPDGSLRGACMPDTPTPVTPTQYATALEDPALRRIAENARFGVGEVIDQVLRALGMEVHHDG